MNRSNHDLNLRSIRQRRFSSIERQDGIHKHTESLPQKSAPIPLLADNQSLLPSGDLEQPPTISMSEVQHRNNHEKSSNLPDSSDSNVIRSELQNIVSELASLTHCIQQQRIDYKKSQDWQFLARIIDRICLILFIIYMIIFIFQAVDFAIKYYEP